MIAASDLREYAYCPRSLYLLKISGVVIPPSPERVMGVIGHTIRRELSIRQSQIMSEIKDPTHLTKSLFSELEDITEDLPHLMGNSWDPSYQKLVAQSKSEAEESVYVLADELEAMIEELGMKNALAYVTPWRIEHRMSSEKLGLCGCVDKIMRNPDPVPVEIKTGRPSRRGWHGDRLQLCAYALLLEEELGQKIRYGVIEYTKTQDQIPVIFDQELRHKVTQTVVEVEKMFAKDMPPVCPHGNPRLCNSCSLEEVCYST